MPPIEQYHSNPELLEWGIPEEGIAIRLHIQQERMYQLSPAVREEVIYTLSRVALIVDRLTFALESNQTNESNLKTHAAYLGRHMDVILNFYDLIFQEEEQGTK